MTYRLYIVSGLSGRFEPALEFDAPNDNAAIVAAELSRDVRAAELWQGSRIVKEWKSQTEPSGVATVEY